MEIKILRPSIKIQQKKIKISIKKPLIQLINKIICKLNPQTQNIIALCERKKLKADGNVHAKLK